MNKLLFVFIAAFLMGFCSCQSQIKLLEANSQAWAGGRQESGSGIKYSVKFIVKQSSDKIFFDTLWVGDRFYPMTKIFINNQKVEKFNSGDTIIFYANQRNYDPQFAPDGYNPDFNKKESPLKGKNKAGIQLHNNKGVKFLIDFELNELPFIARP